MGTRDGDELEVFFVDEISEELVTLSGIDAKSMRQDELGVIGRQSCSIDKPIDGGLLVAIGQVFACLVL